MGEWISCDPYFNNLVRNFSFNYTYFYIQSILEKGQHFAELIDGQLKDFDGSLLHLAVSIGGIIN